MSLADNYSEIKNKIGERARLIAVSKKVAHAKVRELYELGHRDFAENYVQESILKMSALDDLDIRWHCIGALQSNKVKLIVDRFEYIQSVDRDSIAVEIAARSQKPQKILIEVNLAGEESKHGIAVENLPILLETAQKLARLQVSGLMFMPPLDLNEKEQRLFFAKARELRDKMKAKLSLPHNLAELSMGTSHDYEAALKEGSTMVRVGTAIFGARET